MKNINQNSKFKSQKYNSKVKTFLISFVVSFFVIFAVCSFSFAVSKAHAATGINRQINFQGKLVDNNGLNVTDNTYSVVFSLYSVSSSGTALWTETDTVTTKNGIFQVELGATNPLPDTVAFNSDSLYLGIKVGTDAEMTPRIRFTAVPYAINSASLDGVVATQSATGFNLQGGTSSQSTLSFTNNGTALTFQPGVAEGLTIDTNGANTLALGNSANAITFGGSSTTYTFNGNGLTTLGGGLTVDGTALSLGNGANSTIQTTGASSGLTLLSQGLGNITLGQNAGNGNVVISPNAGGQAALIIKDLGTGDLFTASAGATTKFTVDKSGDIVFAGGQTNANSTITSLATTAQNYILPANAGTFCLSTNNCSFAAGTNYWQSLTTGAIEPFNTTYDLLLGGSATTSARFAFINNTGATTPTASISANSGNNAAFLTGTGILGTTDKQTLTLGNVSTGNINFFNTSNVLDTSGNLTLAGAAGITLTGSGADLNFSGTGADTITTANNSDLALMPNGTGHVGVNVSSNLLATLDVRGNSATTPVASVEGTTNFAAMVVNNSGSGDLFTASKSGATKFTIQNDGTVGLDTANYNGCGVLATDANGNIYCSTAGAKETVASVYTITAPSGTNLHINFNGAVDSVPSSASGTITFPANATKIAVVLKGAGGGGGGVVAGSAAVRNAGGGGEGGYSDKYITSISSDYYVKVGGGGAGGTTAGTNGGLGTQTCIGTNSSDACNSPIMNATGGSGGTGVSATGDAAGGAAGTGAGGDVNLTGQAGFNSSTAVGNSSWGGAGGGVGGAPSVTANGNGTNGVNGGGGSGGASVTSVNQTKTGGIGGNGYITFTIYTNSDPGTTSADNWFQYASGVLAPLNLTSDVLIGSNATASAMFGFLNVDGGTPTASISAGSPATGATYLTGTGILQTTNNQTLTIGGSTTGNIIINPSSTSLLGIGTSTPHADIDINGGAETIPVASIAGQTSFAALVVNNSGVGDLFTASKSGATKFTILNNGNIQLAGTNTVLSTLASAATSAEIWTLPNATGTLCLQGSASCGFATGTNEWQQIVGAISPTTITDDLLVGGTSTASARFAVINMVGAGIPTASLSAGINGGAYMTASGVIQTTANQTLSLGGTTTGNILLNPAAGNYVGIDTTNPLATLDVRNATALNGGTIAVASISGKTSFASLVVDNSGKGDLFTASSSGLTRFVITQNGAVGIGTRTPQATYLDISENPAATFIPTKDFVDIGNAAGQEPTADGVNAEQLSWFAKPATGNMSSAQRINVTNNNIATGGQTQALRIVATGAGGVINSDTDGLYIDGLANASKGTTGQDAIEIGANWDNSIFGDGDLRINAGGNILLATSSATTKVAINTTTPLATFDVRGNSATTAIASVSGSTNFAGMVVNNSGSGDLFTASSAGRTKFTVSNSGNVFFGGDTISASSSGAIGNGSPDVINALGDTGSLVPNSGFEADQSRSTLSDGWVPNASNSGTLTLDTLQADAAQGTDSIKWVSGANNQSAAFYSACIPLTSNDIFNLTWSQRNSGVAGGSTVRGYVDQYTTKASCMANTGLTSSLAEGAGITTTWAAPAPVAVITLAGTTTWGRVHIYIASQASGANSTTFIDSVRLIEDTTAHGLDYAEDYPADPNNVPQPGQVVSLETSGSGTMVAPANKYMDQSMIGVISTNPGYVLDDGSMTNPVPIALAGRIPVKVSTINGPIHVGDYLTSSTIPGVAVKATTAGPVIGTAMEDFDCSTALTQLADGQTVSVTAGSDNLCQGQVIMFIKNTVYQPAVAAGGNYELLKNTDLSVFDASSSPTASQSSLLQPLYTIQDGAGVAVGSTTAFANATIANIQAGAVVAKEISTDSLNITTGNITLGGETLNDYIKGIVKQTLSEVHQNTSAAVSVNGLTTASPSAQLVQNILDQKDLSATVSGMIVTGVLGANTIDAKHIAGLIDLSASTISAASISAQTITADTITAKHISGLEVLTTGLQKDDTRITALESLVASSSAIPAVSEQPSSSPTEGITVLPNAISQSTPAGDLRVKGNALIEGILHIAGTLFANDFIVNGVSDFFGNVIFHSGVTFQQTPTFNSDTAGIAVVKKGTDHVDIKFSKAYDQIPVVNASITEVSLTPTPSETPDHIQQRQQEIEQQLLSDNVHFVVIKRTITGFTILLDKPASQDIAFSWLALSVQNSIIFQSDTQSTLTPSPEDTISPNPIDTIIPTAATTSAGF